MAAKPTYLRSLDIVCAHVERDRTDEDGVRHLCRSKFAGNECQHATQRKSMDVCQGFKGVPTAHGPTAKSIMMQVSELYVDRSHTGKTPAPPLSPCIHLGEPTGQTVTCNTCKGGRTELKTFTCNAGRGPCTIDAKRPAAGAVTCGETCYRYSLGPSLAPTITTINLPTVERADNHGSHYNCSIIEWRGKTLLASRLGRNGSSVWLCELDGDFQPVPGTLRDLNIRHPRALMGVEDPRLFEFQGRLHVCVTGYDTHTKGGTSQFIARLNDSLRVEEVWIPQYAKRRSWEKNWATWCGADAIYSVYEIAHDRNHVVLRHENGAAIEVARTKHDFHWAGAVMRGGASPVRVGGEMYHWFHSFTTDRRGMAVYGVGLYTFASSAPFQIIRRVPGTLYVSDRPIRGWSKNVIFPCGAILRGGQWHVSAGHQDRECLVLTFGQAEIERRLK